MKKIKLLVAVIFFVTLNGYTQSLSTITTDSINNITAFTVTMYGNLVNNGGDSTANDGFCYSTSQNPTIADSTVVAFYGNIGSYSFNLDSLKPNTSYYCRAYSTNVKGTAYGNPIKFTTKNLAIPTIITDSIINITAYDDTAYATMTSNGNDPNATAGFCYSTSPNPTTLSQVVYNYNSGMYTGIGPFSLGLPVNPNTNYYLRAFVINAAGTAYGSQLQFTSANFTLPIVTTDSVIKITGTSALGYGNLTNEGYDPNVIGGFCYSTSPNPTTSDSVVYVYDSSATPPNSNIVGYTGGTGPFNVAIIGLTPNTTYFLKAYSTNAAGTSYGSQIQFTTSNVTLPVVRTDSVSDIYTTQPTVEGFGTIISDGNDPQTSVGFCYSQSPNPSLADSSNIATNYSNSGPFYTYLGLNPYTTYYARAYATNAAGTVYGTQKKFTTSNCTNTCDNRIDSVIPGYATSGQTLNITIIGENTHFLAPGLVVHFDFDSDNNSSINSIKIKNNTHMIVNVTIPSDISTNAYNVSVNDAVDGLYSYNGSFIVNIPAFNNQSLASISPHSLIKGQTKNITIKGTNTYFTSGNGAFVSFGFDSAGTSINSMNIQDDSTIILNVTVPANTPSGNYSVNVSDPNDGGLTDSIDVRADGECYAYYSTSYDIVQNTFILAVDSSTIGLASSYYWDFGDGSFSTQAAPSHTYIKDTTYKVCLKVKTSNADICSYCHIIGKDAQGNIYRSAGFSMRVVNSSSLTTVPSTSVSPVQTGILTHKTNQNISIFPNPTTGIINIQGQLDNAQIKITDLLAKSIYQNNTAPSNLQIDLSSQPSGVYFISIQTSEGTLNKKIVISH